jgi:flagellar motor switch protein FliN/FliY
LAALTGVKVEITVVLGRARLPMHQLLRMGRGAVIELEASTKDDVLVLANNLPIAKAEIVIQEDRIAVAITDPISSEDYE